jgi:hypothetical protein
MIRSIFILCYGLVLVTGCATSSITILDKREPVRPFSKILVIYLDEACEFSLFDSTTYNICVKSCFLKTDNFDVRRSVENLLSDKLSGSVTSIIKSSDLYDTSTHNDYAVFRRQIDSFSIDALLIVDIRPSTRDKYIQLPSVPMGPVTSHITLSAGGGTVKVKKHHAGLQCYLMSSRSPAFSVWIASLDAKGGLQPSGGTMQYQSMVGKMAKSLEKSGYIGH